MAPAPRYSWFVLLILGLIYMQQQWSRYSLNYLYNVSADDDFTSIQAADSLSYADYGILTGYGFSATFCLAGLVAGRAADVSSRKLIIFAGCLIWNAALFMIGYSKTYAEVLLWRLALGFGQAFSNPASYSLIADYFPEAQRAQANGLFACGVYARRGAGGGGGVAAARAGGRAPPAAAQVGGGLASLCISMATSLGWRDACFLIAALGFGLAALEGLGVAEPGRGAAKPAGGDAGAPAPGPPKKTFKQALAAIFGNRLVVLVFAASSLRYMGGYAIARPPRGRRGAPPPAHAPAARRRRATFRRSTASSSRATTTSTPTSTPTSSRPAAS